MAPYTGADFQIDQFWLAEFEAQMEPLPKTVVDLTGRSYPPDRFRTITEYQYFYSRSLIAYYHRRLAAEKQAQIVIQRQLVYLGRLHLPIVMVEPTTVVQRPRGRGVMVARRAVSQRTCDQLRTDLRIRLRRLQREQVEQQTALAQQIEILRHTIAEFYAQRIDPAEFIPLGARQPQR